MLRLSAPALIVLISAAAIVIVAATFGVLRLATGPGQIEATDVRRRMGATDGHR